MSLKQLTPGVVQLCGEPNFTPWNAGVLDTTANFSFVSIGESGVNVTVTFAKGDLHSLFNLVGAGLPCSKANCWDLVSGVKSESLSINKLC